MLRFEEVRGVPLSGTTIGLKLFLELGSEACDFGKKICCGAKNVARRDLPSQHSSRED